MAKSRDDYDDYDFDSEYDEDLYDEEPEDEEEIEFGKSRWNEVEEYEREWGE